MCTIFHRLVYEAVKQVPEGKVTTYKAIAEALGDPIAARAVAKVLSENQDPSAVPCHRVVMSDGKIGGYAFGGPSEKGRKLKEEGVSIYNGRVDLKHHLFSDFEVYPILHKMKEAQETIASMNERRDFSFDLVVGVDVSYRGCDGVGVAVVMDLDGNVVEVRRWLGRVTFPYIPTYLAFREAPFMVVPLKGIKDVLLLVDGQGTAHPRKAGEAVHVGAVLDLPSLGVAKSPLLRGQRPYRGAYVSPGWMLPDESMVDRVWLGGRKQPKPLELAHRYATKLRDELLKSP